MITKKQALDALDDLDDYCRMEIMVDPQGPYLVLKKYIEQQENTSNVPLPTTRAVP